MDTTLIKSGVYMYFSPFCILFKRNRNFEMKYVKIPEKRKVRKRKRMSNKYKENGW